MLTPLIQRCRRSAGHPQGERGVTLALVAVAIFSIIAMAGLSIDVGTLYEASAEAQRAADAGALAAARVISMSGLTGDPTNGTGSGTNPGTVSWSEVCGGATSPATAAAIAVAQQNTISGAQLPAGSITVSYSAGSTGGAGVADCSSLAGSSSFGVNPVVTVKVTQASLPTYFSRIWGRTGSSVSATATAEAFNPSNSGAYSSTGNIVPVQPRCVKPWMVPNYDPLTPTTPAYSCTTGNCTQFVDPATGAIQRPGILPDGSGVIGEKFWLVPDCGGTGPTCSPPSAGPQIQANVAGPPVPPNLEYLPGQTLYASGAIPSDGSTACSSVAASTGNYAAAIAGCDQSTQYQCGNSGTQNVVDLGENPAAGDTMNGTQCLIHQDRIGGGPSGQDELQLPGATAPNYPFQIQVGSNNPLLTTGLVGNNDFITSSTSIASLPIFDTSTMPTFTSGGTTNVTVIGFLQVFIHRVNASGNVLVTVMNVSGCGNTATGTTPFVVGTSPVPVRLITPP